MGIIFFGTFSSNATHVLSGYTGGYVLNGGLVPEAPIGITDVGTSTKMSYQYIPCRSRLFVNGDLSIATSKQLFLIIIKELLLRKIVSMIYLFQSQIPYLKQLE
jgi:hypothetical protein